MKLLVIKSLYLSSQYLVFRSFLYKFQGRAFNAVGAQRSSNITANSTDTCQNSFAIFPENLVPLPPLPPPPPPPPLPLQPQFFLADEMNSACNKNGVLEEQQSEEPHISSSRPGIYVTTRMLC